MSPSSLETARWTPRPPVAGGMQRRAARRRGERGILSLILLLLFVAQSSVWSVHGHAPGPDAGNAGDYAREVAEAIETADGETHSLAPEPCDVCEMARRTGSESLPHEDEPALAIMSIARRAPTLRPNGIPTAVELASAAPRAPPLALL